MVDVHVEISGMGDFYYKSSRYFYVCSGAYWDINLYMIFLKSIHVHFYVIRHPEIYYMLFRIYFSSALSQIKNFRQN